MRKIDEDATHKAFPSFASSPSLPPPLAASLTPSLSLLRYPQQPRLQPFPSSATFNNLDSSPPPHSITPFNLTLLSKNLVALFLPPFPIICHCRRGSSPSDHPLRLILLSNDSITLFLHPFPFLRNHLCGTAVATTVATLMAGPPPQITPSDLIHLSKDSDVLFFLPFSLLCHHAAAPPPLPSPLRWSFFLF